MLLHRDLLLTLRKDKVVCELYRASSATGIDSYLTGGFLRDLFLYKQYNLPKVFTYQSPPSFSTVFEYDVAISGDPYRFSMEIIKEAKGSSFCLDRKRGIYRVLAYPEAITLRPSPVGDGVFCHKGVQIDISKLLGADILGDLEKRDFTINAMAIPVKSIFSKEGCELIDPYNGWEDIKKRLLKALSRNVFEDDPVRLLRAIRLSALTGFKIEDKTEEWIKDCSYLIKEASAERIREELFNIFSSLESWQYIKRLNSLGLLKEILPLPYDVETPFETLKASDRLLAGLKAHFSTLYNILRDHLLNPIGGLPRYSLFKFTALLHDTILKVESGEREGDKRLATSLRGEEAKNLFLLLGERLRLSKKGVKLLTNILLNHHEAILLKKGGIGERGMASFFREFGEDGVDIILFTMIDPDIYRDKDSLSHIKGFLSYYFDIFSKRPLPPLLKGDEIMEILGILPGKEVGEMLKAIRLAEREEKIKSKEEAIGFLRKVYRGLSV